MFLCKYWKADLSGLIVFLLIGLFLWMGNKNIDSNEICSIKSYGGNLSDETQSILKNISNDLENLVRIIDAHPNHLLIVTANNKIKDYKYAYDTIWCNDKAVILNVKSFHFGYRDVYGNLLTQVSKKIESVETIEYLMRINKGKNEIFTANEVRLPYEMITYSGS